VLDIAKFAGTYNELVRWRDSSGRTGELRGTIDIQVEADRVSLSSGDGHTMIGRLPAQVTDSIELVGSGGDATSKGRLYVGDQTLVLEYEADVRGRHESNVDVWTFVDGAVMRAGLIRQNEVTIWFEAQMEKG
jgi:hypothetical protein